MKRLRSSALVSILVTALLAGATPARSQDKGDLNLWPLLNIDREADGTEVHILSPLGEWTNKGDHEVRALRPLVIYQRRGEDTLLDLPWPIAGIKRLERGSFDHVFPFYWGTDQDDDKYFRVFPLVWTWREADEGGEWGVVVFPAWNVQDFSPEGDRSRGLFPLWMNRYDADRAWRSLWLLPFYRATDDASKSRAGFFPLWYRWRDGDETGTWLAPVYRQADAGETTMTVVFPFLWKGENSTVLFPFYWNMDQSDILAVFPFYGRIRTAEDSESRFILFPLYADSREGENKTRYVLFPILSWGGDGKGQSEFSVFPLWSRSDQVFEGDREGFARSRSAMWPIAWWGNEDWREVATETKAQVRSQGAHFNLFPILWTGRRNEDNFDLTQPDENQISSSMAQHFNLFPLFWSGSRTFEQMETDDEAGEGAKFKRSHHWLLPLYTFNRAPDETTFSMLWPLWRQRDSFASRRYCVLWRLLDMRFTPEGDHVVSVLWRGYRDEISGPRREVDVFPFITYRRREGSHRRWQFLSGFFEWGVQSDARYMRLFYLPRIPLGGAKNS